MVNLADFKAFVGMDYHESGVQVCVLDRDGIELGSRPVENQLGAIVEFVDHARDGRPVMGVAIESCCGAANLAEELRKQGWEVELAHAGICSRMKQNPDKTDLSDAHLLADLVRVGYLPRVWLPPEEIRDLRRLTRHRTQLAEERRRIKLRMGAMLREGAYQRTQLILSKDIASFFLTREASLSLLPHRTNLHPAPEGPPAQSSIGRGPNC